MAVGALMDLILHVQRHVEAERKLEFELATILSLLEVALHALGATKILHLVRQIHVQPFLQVANNLAIFSIWLWENFNQ